MGCCALALQGQDSGTPRPIEIAALLADGVTAGPRHSSETVHHVSNWTNCIWPVKIHEALHDKGISPYLSYTAEIMGNVRGGIRRGSAMAALLEAGLDLDLEKLMGWSGATFNASMFYPHGRSLSSKYVGDLFVASNIDAYDAVRLYELWIEQTLLNEKISIKIGQVSTDKDFFLSDLGALFCSSAFGWPPVLGVNVPSAAYPVAVPGVRLKLTPNEKLSWQMGVYDGNPDPGNAIGEPLNQNGVRFNLNEGAMLISEIAFTPSKTVPTFYKLGGWYHTERFNDMRMDDSGLSLADPASSGVPRSHTGNWGIYGLVDQWVWSEKEAEGEQGLGIFARAGWTRADRNLNDLFLNGGITYTGLLPGRNEDQAGFGVAYGRMSRQGRELVRDADLLKGTSTRLPDHEIAFELTYRIAIKSWWSLQPDLQYIVHPGGSGTLPNAVVVGLRSYLIF